MKLTGKAKAEFAMAQAQAVKAQRLMLYDVSQWSNITDFIIVCEGTSQAHVRGIADKIIENMKQRQMPANVEGYSEGSWVLLDYEDVMVHIFHPETRNYYQLEELYNNSLVAAYHDDHKNLAS